MKKNNTFLALIIIFSVLIIDQWIKIWVKTNMYLGQEFSMLGTWDKAMIHFVENEGMAFGWKLDIEKEGYDYGKLLLSLFRIGAVTFLIYYIRSLIKENVPKGLILSFSLILAGAIGNIIDSAVYGLIFSESSYHSENVAQLFPTEGGYASFLHGKVVDMFYFPLAQGIFPAWIPWLGGKTYFLFPQVFNFADAAITVGVISLLLFQRAYFNEAEKNEAAIAVATTENDIAPITTEDIPEIPNEVNSATDEKE